MDMPILKLDVIAIEILTFGGMNDLPWCHCQMIGAKEIVEVLMKVKITTRT